MSPTLTINIYMNMLTRSSKRIFNPMRYIGTFAIAIDCENSNEDVTLESSVLSTDRKHSRLQLRCFKFVN